MISNNKLLGYGFEAEPKMFNTYKGNVWAAPAYGWTTDGSLSNLMDKWADNMVRTKNGEFPNKVN